MNCSLVTGLDPGPGRGSAARAGRRPRPVAPIPRPRPPAAKLRSRWIVDPLQADAERAVIGIGGVEPATCHRSGRRSARGAADAVQRGTRLEQPRRRTAGRWPSRTAPVSGCRSVTFWYFHRGKASGYSTTLKPACWPRDRTTSVERRGRSPAGPEWPASGASPRSSAPGPRPGCGPPDRASRAARSAGRAGRRRGPRASARPLPARRNGPRRAATPGRQIARLLGDLPQQHDHQEIDTEHHAYPFPATDATFCARPRRVLAPSTIVHARVPS